ncbi:phenylalanine--tRNA ligase subunit beta, partial [Schleiferiaceae bacterium]|nr:phenylalanine--tRNA ligase subunit beta [Schleiferiaceae bacterium]
MKISYRWLKRYLPIDLNPELVSELLTDTGLEVEGLEEVETIPGGLRGVVVGEVLTCEQHPNADRLRITTVNIGMEDAVQIVCGAPNVAAGQKVPVATVGTTLYPGGEELKIKKGKIRGEVSMGMICAEDELGLGSGHDGIMVLDDSLKPGIPCSSVFDVESDFVFEIGLTPNRTDAMGHIGVARDLRAAMITKGMDAPELEEPKLFASETAPNPIDLRIEDEGGCPSYHGTFIANVTIEESPDWLKEHLVAIGLTPKNNAVDITNFVLHTFGHPLHAFDADAIEGNTVIVRKAKMGEKLITLDEVERALDQQDCVIADATKPMCIAG